MGSATPRTSRGCPPKMECMIPQIAVEANVSTTLKLPSTFKQEIIQSYYQKMCIGERILQHNQSYSSSQKDDEPTDQPTCVSTELRAESNNR